MHDLVVNTGPMIALCAALEDLDVLSRCYSSICLPFEVVTELKAGPNGREDVQRIRDVTLFDIQPKPLLLKGVLTSILDAGEAAVIQTALQQGVKRVAIDEKTGRRMARLNGLSVTGSVGMLLKCAKPRKPSGKWFTDRNAPPGVKRWTCSPLPEEMDAP